MEDKEFLAHVGVLGMKWGKRKGRRSAASKAEARKEKIMGSASKLYRHRKEFSQPEIEAAVKKLKMDREIKTLSRDRLAEGSKIVSVIMAYGAVGLTAYKLAKSPAGEAVKNVVKTALIRNKEKWVL